MNEHERQTRSHLMGLFKRHGFNPRTIFGQNFLIDINLVEYIAEQGRLTRNDVVLEIGTGTGGLTAYLADYAGEVVTVEIDGNMHALAKDAVGYRDNVTLLNTDALKNKNHFSPELIDLIQEKLAEDPERTLKLVANLPYNIATPVISNLVATELPWSRMVVTIQLELGQRMAAKPGHSTYGALSVWLQAQCRVRMLKQVRPTVFWPRPKVMSAIMQLTPDVDRRQKIVDRPFFHDFVRRLFQHRRKLMRSVIVSMYRKQLSKATVDESLAAESIDLGVRAEQLKVGQLVAISNRLHAANKTAALLQDDVGES
ncbi:MAG: 16S rRNA (adenine(1518)-N(6)/adenine(1519)-N(6))-dimethyltransferase RsmA [Planctomycetota bacterium]|nr:16S rRNA (adenine(1518)-N(6)/adenine(1519)-N(6))-dimethyltransferase RsmA [Planctomycetota bacterium]